MELAERFARLFQGNPRSRGVFDPTARDGRLMYTLHEPPLPQTYVDHLAGRLGMGLVPILDDDTCLWGAVDIDAHGDAEPVDLVGLEKEVRMADLPLMVCRSKSGGAHLYLFCSEPIPAKLVRAALNKWAAVLHRPGAEVFPKQDKLLKDKEGRQLGNWINLCYFNASDPACLRYCIEGGKRIDLAYFVEVAESRRVTAAVLVEKSDGDHNGAPPCIHRMITGGVAAGYRNEALYNLCIYLRQAYPETWQDKAYDLNARIFSEPLPHSEAKKTIGSVARRSYRYKCKEEPCRSLCNSFVCVERKFGITKEESAVVNMGAHPEFGLLRKYQTEPARWGLDINGVEINLSTTDLMDHRKVREAVAEKLTMIIPPMKVDRWLVSLQKLMSEAIVIEAPEEASSHGLIMHQLLQFLQRANLDSDGKDPADRSLLLRGVPVVQEKDGQRLVYFRGADFVAHLRKNRAEELRGPNLWFALKKHGVLHSSLRIGQTVRQVWSLPVEDVPNARAETKPIKPEF